MTTKYTLSNIVIVFCDDLAFEERTAIKGTNIITLK
jgi:predicted AAA+ superfamily ATPase